MIYDSIKELIDAIKEEECFKNYHSSLSVFDHPDVKSLMNEMNRLKEEGIKFSLVLLDPPYGMKVNMDIIHTLKDNGNLMDGCIIVVEDLTEEKLEYEAPFRLIKENNYGITCLQIVKYEEAAM